MLIIRKQQIQVLEQVSRHSFEEDMVRHLRQFAPKHAELLGAAGLRRMVHLAIARAGHYQFKSRDVIRFYTDLMFMLGSDFDTDPQFPWAAQVLTDRSVTSEAVRSHRLYNLTIDYLESVAGPDNRYAIEALRRASRQRFDDLWFDSNDRYQGILDRLRLMYPQKCAYLGGGVLRELIDYSVVRAQQHSINDHAGIALITGLIFSFGHGFATDPQFPWIETTLAHDFAEPAKRLERLFAKTMTYLERALTHLEQQINVPGRLQ